MDDPYGRDFLHLLSPEWEKLENHITPNVSLLHLCEAINATKIWIHILQLQNLKRYNCFLNKYFSSTTMYKKKNFKRQDVLEKKYRRTFEGLINRWTAKSEREPLKWQNPIKAEKR